MLSKIYKTSMPEKFAFEFFWQMGSVPHILFNLRENYKGLSQT